MKLNEFFSRPLDLSSKQKGVDQNKHIRKDDLFWYIIDHDKIHKDYFFEIAKKEKKSKNLSPEQILELYMPMVKKGCKEYYSHKKLNGRLGKLFPEDMREELCHKLHDHYSPDIQKSKYKLG